MILPAQKVADTCIWGKFRLPLGLLSLALVLTLPCRSEAAQVLPTDKISPVVLAHREAKRQPMGVSIAEHRSNLVAQGLNASNLEGEECALYSSNRLSQAEIDQLAAKGIVVTPDLWIPPVAGKHPLGFHLATVNYANLDTVRADARFVRLESTEFQNKPMNDLACTLINADDVHNGTGTAARNGAGIKVAVADSGVDLTHSDIPTPVEAYDMTTGTSPANWSTTVANTVTPHGTHVTATAVGRGTLSSGKYQGSASGASLCFYKIGSSTDGTATDTDMIEAINRAATVGAKVFTMSYGGFSTYLDGSESVEQAIDSAVAAGVTVFVSAGNEADAALHYSASVPPATTSSSFSYAVTNTTGSTYKTPEYIQVIWRDNSAGDYNVTLACSNLSAGGPNRETLTLASSSSSTRGTESQQYKLTPNIATGTNKTYLFTLQNTASSGNTPLVHCYQISGLGTFANADPTYTVGHPAVADGAIAVGAWTQRRSWTNYKGTGYYYPSLTVGTLASFSSLGPRIDGVQKPDIVAPGAATISARDSVSGLAATDALIVDNDGATLDGSGPANYYVMLGTSMASPMAAGVAALVLQSNPTLTPAQVRAAITNTASMAATPNNSVGYGLINALTAVDYYTSPSVTLSVISARGGTYPGTVTTNWGAALSQWVTNSPIAVSASTQYVCTAGTVLSNAYSQAATTNVTLALTNSATLTWQWQTQYRLTAQTNGNGSVTAINWCAAGSNAVLTASAAANWHFARWSGDTNGCAIAGNVVTAAMTQARTLLATFEIDQKTLTVVSSHGGAYPGTVTTDWGSALSQWVTNSPVPVSVSTQYLCTAGIVAGNAYTQAATTNVTLTLTNSATLTWQWQTQYWLTTQTNGNGSVTAANGWCASGSNAVLTASPAANWHLKQWSGDTNGCAIAGNVVTAAMTQARALLATFEIDQKTLTVVSSYGGAYPGTVTTDWGSALSQWVTNSPALNGASTQYVCTAGTVLSNAYTQAAATNVTLTLTNSAILTWQWQANYWLTTQTNGNGSVTAANGWCASGSNAVLTASPAANWHLKQWSGDTNGCAIAGNVVTAAMTQARALLATFEIDQKTLTVVSSHGGAYPGTVATDWGSALSQWVTNSPALNGASTQYVCTAGTVLSNAYTQAATTNVTLTLTNSATLTWQWQTQYWLAAQTNGSGSVTAADGWYAAESNAVLTATAAPYWHFTEWSGNTNGCDSSGNAITVTMTQARTVVANFTENLAPMGTPEQWLSQYGLTNGPPSTQELLDQDGDGMFAWQEYVADTDPTNPASVLSILGIVRDGDTVRVDWKGGHWARQYIEIREDLSATNTPWTCIATNAALPTPTTNFTVQTGVALPTLFYRIHVER